MNLLQLFSLFKKGSCVSNPAKWKNIQINSTLIASILVVLANIAALFGYSIPMDIDTANSIAAGFIAVLNVILTLVTSNKVGVGKIEDKNG